MNEAISLIAFTSGLDSTYVLHEELKKGHKVAVLYANVTQGSGQKVAELTCRRRILAHFKQLFPGQIVEEWVTTTPAVYIQQKIGGNRWEGGRPQLVQQYNTMNALMQVIIESESDVLYRPMTGWHSGDVVENNPTEAQTEEMYKTYKDTFKQLINCIDVRRTVHCALLTPAWDVDKRVMWDSLDEWTRNNISICYFFEAHGDETNSMLVAMHSDKVKEYKAIGITPQPSVMCSYHLLTDLDRMMVGVSTAIHDSHESSLGKRCGSEWQSTALNTVWVRTAVSATALRKIKPSLPNSKI